MGATLHCSLGVTTSHLVVVAGHGGSVEGKPLASVRDHRPLLNILPFGMCISAQNPAVARAAGAPVPCIPNTLSPWVVGSPTVLVGKQPCLDNGARLVCTWGGIIEVIDSGQFKLSIP